MSRSVIIFFSSVLILVSLFGISNPSTSVEWLMAASNQLDGLRVGVAMALLIFGTLIPLESRAVRYVFRLLGLFMLAILAGNWFFPDFYLERGIHLLSLDFITLFEGAIVCLLFSMYQSEEPAVLPQWVEKTKAGGGQPPMARPV